MYITREEIETVELTVDGDRFYEDSADYTSKIEDFLEGLSNDKIILEIYVLDYVIGSYKE
ncbi:hypothetical protein MBCUT_04950 [Methanobrevibacter cuticularis]|uniref:Uncharacterized protein n=1 Tax=Methanobrevibacter cuticularis TaxID=47311 RepID=A0A166EPB6_9EURY|nr:hypothetical protein [Methanobrevibacter cuticularis]KZX16865.1 hypothetical protein MBCUT_04950 [Methanobrevibacter cuticularis]